MRPEEDGDGRLVPGGVRAEDGLDDRSGTDPDVVEIGAPEGDPEGQVEFWRARAQELEQQLATSRARLLELADVLPPALAVLVHGDIEALRVSLIREDLLAEWEETVALQPASVAAELERLWSRLGRRPDS